MRGRGTPRQRPLSAVSWRHGDKETWRQAETETETRAVHAILSPLLGFGKLSCFVSGDRLTHNMAYGALARGLEGLRFLSAKGLQGALKKHMPLLLGSRTEQALSSNQHSQFF